LNDKEAAITHIEFNRFNTMQSILCATNDPEIFLYIYKLQFPNVDNWYLDSINI
jgi:hypothetical protein